MTTSSQANRLLKAALWLGAHALLLAIFVDRGDYIAAIVNHYTTIHPGILALVALVGVIGAVVIARAIKFQLPAWLVAMRRNPVFYTRTVALGTLLIAPTWLNVLNVTPVRPAL